MAERTNAERNWQTARAEEQQSRREIGEAFRTEGQRGREGYRESGYGGAYQPSSYEPTGGRGYGVGWQPGGPRDYAEGGYYGQGERGGYGRPPGFRYQGPGYGASSGYHAEVEGGEWGGRPGGEFRPGSFGPGAREGMGPRGGQWGGLWRGSEGERGSYGGGGGWRAEGPWDQDRDFGEEGGWGGGAGFRGGFGGGFTGQARGGGGGFTRWQGGEGSWRGGGAPGYQQGGWSRGPDWSWQSQGPGGYGAEPGWSAEHGRGAGYAQGMRGGWWGTGPAETEAGQWRGQREWGEPGRGMTGGYGDPWTVPGPFTGRGPEGYQRSGDSIRDDVCERLTRHGQVDASAIRVRVESNNEVVLEGTVPDRRTKRLAEDVADSVSGVRDVQNRLRVSDREDARGGTGMYGTERDSRESEQTGQTGHAGGHGGMQSDESRGGRPERDAEKHKATTGRAKS